MMDYAGRVAEGDTYPKLLRLNAKEYGGEIALREKDFGLWKIFTWNDYQTRVHDFALGMVELGLGRGDVVGRNGLGGEIISTDVMAGQKREARLHARLSRPSTPGFPLPDKTVDARHKAGHDE